MEKIEGKQNNHHDGSIYGSKEENVGTASCGDLGEGIIDWGSLEEQKQPEHQEQQEQQERQEQKFVYEEVPLLHGSNKMDEYRKNPDYLVYLINNEQGFAVKKTEAVDILINKVEEANDSKTMEMAMGLGREIKYGKSNLPDEEKKRAAEFMETPVFKTKELMYRIEEGKKRLKQYDEWVERSRKELAEVSVGNWIKRKLENRGKIAIAGDRLSSMLELQRNTATELEENERSLASLQAESSNRLREEQKAA